MDPWNKVAIPRKEFREGQEFLDTWQTKRGGAKRGLLEVRA